MADQPERPIEKLLRAWGKQRLPTDSFRLHAATRRVLQGQVAEVYSRKQRKILWFSYLTLPRLTWSFGILLTGGLAIWFATSSIKHDRPQNLLAQRDKAARHATEPGTSAPTIAMRGMPTEESHTAEAAKTALSLQENAAPPLPQLEQQKGILASATVGSEEKPSTDGPGVSALNVGAVASAPRIELGNTGNNNALSRALASPAAAAAATRQSDMLAKVENFVQTPSNAAASKVSQQTSGVLDAFQFVQSGSEVRIIDQDGSVYVGSLRRVPAAPQSQAQRKQQLVTTRSEHPVEAIGPPPSAPAQEFLFKVTGTNRTLQQRLVFNGRWYSSGEVQATRAYTNRMRSQQVMGARALPAATDSGGAPRVSGTAVIGNTQNIEVNATSVQP